MSYYGKRRYNPPADVYAASTLVPMQVAQRQALQFNIDAAQRELDQRDADGEDVSHLRVCQLTAAIVKVTT